ncbi:MAG: DUF4143 domain-containing protein, partial [Chitinivibrionales bacterium]|nr:DUF4143 domain-containing protein [Chitinivibrionales bacterium]
IGDLPGEYPQARCFVVDEVQKVPEILSDLHRLIEDRKDLQWILTGSSCRKLKRTGVDLLAGRALNRCFHPLMAIEMGEYFDLKRALDIGMLPLIVSADNPAATRGSYIDLYLDQEVREEGLTRNVGAFARFLETMSFSQGAVTNLSEISRDSEVKRNTVDSFVSILEDLLIGVRIPPFERRAKRAVVKSRKFYFFDCGVYQGIRPRGPLDDSSSLQGVVLETLVMQHLRAWIDYSGAAVRLYFWRTRGGSEVDFVLYGDRTFVAIEVKNTARPRSRDTAGLRTFVRDYPESAVVLLYRGTERKRRDGVLWIPVEQFLRELTPDAALSEVLHA